MRRKVVSDSDDYEDEGEDDIEEEDDDIVAGMFNLTTSLHCNVLSLTHNRCRYERR